MLKIRIIAIGKTKGSWAKDAQSHYQKLLSRFCKLEIIEAPERASRDGSLDSRKAAEAAQIRKRLNGGLCMCLDQRGAQYSSEELAELISLLLNDGQSELNIVIGGAYGLDEELLNACDMRVSLSALTFSHQIARITLLEQLFRCYSILANTPYHK